MSGLGYDDTYFRLTMHPLSKNIIQDALSDLGEAATELSAISTKLGSGLLRTRKFIIANSAETQFIWPYDTGYDLQLRLKQIGKKVQNTTLSIFNIGKLPTIQLTLWDYVDYSNSTGQICALELVKLCKSDRDVLRIVNRLRAAKWWCCDRIDGLKKYTQNLAKQSSKWTGLLEGEAVLCMLRR